MKFAKAVVGALGLIIASLTAALADDVLNFNEVGTTAAVTIEAVLTVWAIWKARDYTINSDVQGLR